MRKTINHNYVPFRGHKGRTDWGSIITNGVAVTFVAVTFAIAVAGFITP